MEIEFKKQCYWGEFIIRIYIVIVNSYEVVVVLLIIYKNIVSALYDVTEGFDKQQGRAIEENERERKKVIQ